MAVMAVIHVCIPRAWNLRVARVTDYGIGRQFAAHSYIRERGLIRSRGITAAVMTDSGVIAPKVPRTSVSDLLTNVLDRAQHTLQSSPGFTWRIAPAYTSNAMSKPTVNWLPPPSGTGHRASLASSAAL